MKHYLSILLFIFLSGNSFGQLSDKIVSKTDTTTCTIIAKNKKDGYHIYFTTGQSNIVNEVYPENAEFAYSENQMFISIKPPETDKKVWARCFFDGEYRLLQHKYVNYIATPENIYRLSPANEKTDEDGTTQRNRFIGEMIAILSNKVDYNFKQLQYNTKSLVRPLIQYHEINSLSFHDYNDYYPAKLSLGIFLGGGIESVHLNLQPDDDYYGRISPVVNKEFFQLGGLTANLTIPKLSNRLYFTGGFEFARHKASAIRKIETSGPLVYFADLQYSAFSIAFPLGAGFEVLKSNIAAIAIQTTLKPWIVLEPDTELKLETELNNVVQSKLLKANKNQDIDFFHHLGLKIYSPAVSKKLSVIVGYDYSLTPGTENINSVSHTKAISFTANYNF